MDFKNYVFFFSFYDGLLLYPINLFFLFRILNGHAISWKEAQLDVN